MNKLIKFGENVEGYNIAVLNEREIRAAALIFFLFMLIFLMLILFKGDFLLIKYVIETSEKLLLRGYAEFISASFVRF